MSLPAQQKDEPMSVLPLTVKGRSMFLLGLQGERPSKAGAASTSSPFREARANVTGKNSVVTVTSRVLVWDPASTNKQKIIFDPHGPRLQHVSTPSMHLKETDEHYSTCLERQIGMQVCSPLQ